MIDSSFHFKFKFIVDFFLLDALLLVFVYLLVGLVKDSL
jgi:hypothetical protein